MQCRKRLEAGKDTRCANKASTEGYCAEHWYEYQIGLEFHDPSQDFDYIDPELNELLSTLENSGFYNNRIEPKKVELLNNKNTFKEIKQTLNQTSNNKVNLEKFSKDNQNVHTSALVEKTVNVAKKLIELGKESYTEDTLVDVIKKCKLNHQAEENMIEHYFLDSNVYELPKPTYKLVLDGLWVYIHNQKAEDRDNLIERLRQELEDNVGTCAQGNLSRLVNTLNGFTHTVEEETSVGDLMKALLSEPNLSIRMKKAKDIIKDRKIKKEDADAWLELIKN
jgi:hypothetical protein